MKELPEEIDGTEFWTPPAENYFTDLLVSPNSMEDVKEYLKEKKMEYDVLIRDIQVSVFRIENKKF